MSWINLRSNGWRSSVTFGERKTISIAFKFFAWLRAIELSSIKIPRRGLAFLKWRGWKINTMAWKMVKKDTFGQFCGWRVIRGKIKFGGGKLRLFYIIEYQTFATLKEKDDLNAMMIWLNRQSNQREERKIFQLLCE